MNQETIPTFKEVTISISMSKSIFLEVPEGMTDEQLKEKARQEILTPDEGLKILRQVLLQSGARINQGDFADWNVDELEYIVSDGGSSSTTEGE